MSDQIQVSLFRHIPHLQWYDIQTSILFLPGGNCVIPGVHILFRYFQVPIFVQSLVCWRSRRWENWPSIATHLERVHRKWHHPSLKSKPQILRRPPVVINNFPEVPLNIHTCATCVDSLGAPVFDHDIKCNVVQGRIWHCNKCGLQYRSNFTNHLPTICQCCEQFDGRSSSTDNHILLRKSLSKKWRNDMRWNLLWS